MDLQLPAAGVFDTAHALAVLKLHSLPAQEELDEQALRIRRVLQVGGGLVEVRISLNHAGLAAVHDAAAACEPQLAAILDHWFGLSQDTAPAYAQLAALPQFQPLAQRFPHLRLISYPDMFEALATTVLGQQVSLAAARTLGNRYVAALGQAHPSGLRTFPTAQQTASCSPLELQKLIRCPLARATTLHMVAAWYHSTGSQLLQRPSTFLAELMALRGVGPWTRDYVALRGLCDPGVFLGSDLVVRRALRSLEAEVPIGASLPAGSSFLATLLLWAHDAQQRRA